MPAEVVMVTPEILEQICPAEMAHFDQLPKEIRQIVANMPMPPPSHLVLNAYKTFGENFCKARCQDDIDMYYDQFERETGIKLTQKPLVPVRRKRTFR